MNTDKVIREVAVFRAADAAVRQMRHEYMGIVVAGPDDRDGVKRAHAARMVAKGHRVEVEKTRKALKAELLVRGRLIDGVAKRITEPLRQIEDHLQYQEDTPAREAERLRREQEERRAAVRRERDKALRQCGYRPTEDMSWDDAVELPQDEFGRLIAEEMAARRAEEEERERQRAVAEQEREKQRAEETRLREERERQEQEARRLAEERRDLELAQARQQAAEEARQAEIVRQQREAEAEARAKAAAEERRRINSCIQAEAMRPVREKIMALVVRLDDIASEVNGADWLAPDAVQERVRVVLARASSELEAIAQQTEQ